MKYNCRYEIIILDMKYKYNFSSGYKSIIFIYGIWNIILELKYNSRNEI